MKKYCKGSSVVEMAYIMPVVLFTWMCIMFALFYYYDKSILSGAAYETVVMGSELWMCSPEEKEEKCYLYMKERTEGKLLFFGDIHVSVVVEEETIEVRAEAIRYKMKVQIEEQAAVTNPTDKVRITNQIKDRLEENIE